MKAVFAVLAVVSTFSTLALADSCPVRYSVSTKDSDILTAEKAKITASGTILTNCRVIVAGAIDANATVSGASRSGFSTKTSGILTTSVTACDGSRDDAAFKVFIKIKRFEAIEDSRTSDFAMTSSQPCNVGGNSVTTEVTHLLGK